MLRYLLTLIPLTLLFGSVDPIAADTVNNCKINDDSGAVVVLVCEANTGEEDWKTAGKSACKGRGLCNAWIWLGGTHAPRTAPKTDADFSKDKTRHARAIWVNDSQSLVKLRKIAN